MRRLLALVASVRAAFRAAGGAGRPPRVVPPGEPDRGAEAIVALLLLAATVCSIGFVFVYADDGLPHQTQWGGLALAAALGCLAAALIVVARRLVVTEHRTEDYPEPESPADQVEIAQMARESTSRFTRKRMLAALGGLAGGSLGLAMLTPAVSLGPLLSSHRLLETPWRPGRRLVDENDVPIRADDIEEGAFYTAYAEGASHDEIGSPLVVVRVAPGELKLPRARRRWAPGGIVAYSKICTHAGCAIALYRKPTFREIDPRPALVCPCHYSTFDAGGGGTVISGPAGRDLPQLPLAVGADGVLIARGNLSAPPGPSWWGVRMWKARFDGR
jgi:ubiquinol-cytochrome c reductase iron-sulfur subunit